MRSCFPRTEQVCIETPRACVAVLALQILPARVCGRDFEAASWEIDLFGPVVVGTDKSSHRPLGQLRDGAGAVVLEDAAGRVRGRAAGPEEIAAIKDDDIGDAATG